MNSKQWKSNQGVVWNVIRKTIQGFRVIFFSAMLFQGWVAQAACTYPSDVTYKLADNCTISNKCCPSTSQTCALGQGTDYSKAFLAIAIKITQNSCVNDNNPAVIQVAPGNYPIVSTVRLPSNTTVVLSNGARLYPSSTASFPKGFFYIRDVSNVTFRSEAGGTGVIDGRVGGQPGSSPMAMGIIVSGNSSNVSINNITIQNITGDGKGGIYGDCIDIGRNDGGPVPSQVTVSEIVCENFSRNGISVTGGSQLTISNNTFKQDIVNGSAVKSLYGIDVEPNNNPNCGCPAGDTNCENNCTSDNPSYFLRADTVTIYKNSFYDCGINEYKIAKEGGSISVSKFSSNIKITQNDIHMSQALTLAPETSCHDLDAHQGRGITVEKSTNVSVQNNSILSANSGSNYSVGFRAYGVKNLKFRDNTIQGALVGVILGNLSWLDPTNAQSQDISNNSISVDFASGKACSNVPFLLIAPKPPMIGPPPPTIRNNTIKFHCETSPLSVIHFVGADLGGTALNNKAETYELQGEDCQSPQLTFFSAAPAQTWIVGTGNTPRP